MLSTSWFINYLYCWIYSSYILHKKLNKIPLCLILKPKITSRHFTYSHSFSFVASFVVTHCYLLLPVVIRCNSLLFNVIRCTTLCHSLSLDVQLFCIFINNQNILILCINTVFYKVSEKFLISTSNNTASLAVLTR